jgi:hypothetical protein
VNGHDDKGQANSYAIPYCVARFGCNKSLDDEKVTAVFIAGVKASLEPSIGQQLETLIAENKAGFAIARSAFGSALATYQSSARGIARDILQVVFFVDRGAPRDVIKEDIRARIDTIHELLGLQEGQACFGPQHPLVAEYGPIRPNHRLRLFPEKGANGLTIAKVEEGSETLAFIEALGKPHLDMSHFTQSV